MKNEEGFTVVEIVVAMAIGIVLMFAVFVAMESGRRSSVAVERKVTATQDVRAALEIMALEIGMASYNPNLVPGIWQASDCTASSNQSYKGIQEATDLSIVVEMDINENSLVYNSGSDSNEVIRYAYDAGNKYLTRSTNCGGNQAFLGDIPANPRAVRVINGDIGIPVFRYYDGNGVLITSLPAGIPNIRRVEITLAVETEDIDPNLGERRRMIYSTSIMPRNHAMAY